MEIDNNSSTFDWKSTTDVPPLPTDYSTSYLEGKWGIHHEKISDNITKHADVLDAYLTYGMFVLRTWISYKEAQSTTLDQRAGDGRSGGVSMCCLFGILDYGGKLSRKEKAKILSVLSVACEERGFLQSLFDSGTGITAIAIILQRTELAVIQQAQLMDLFTPPHKKRKYSPRQPKCLCCNCKLDPAFCPRRQPPMPVQEVVL